MNDLHEDLYELLAKISYRKNETTQMSRDIQAFANHVFNEQQVNIEKLQTKAARGDPKAQAAYMGLLRGRKILPEKS